MVSSRVISAYLLAANCNGSSPGVHFSQCKHIEHKKWTYKWKRSPKSILTRTRSWQKLIECWLSIYEAFLKLLRWCTWLVTIFEHQSMICLQFCRKNMPQSDLLITWQPLSLFTLTKFPIYSIDTLRIDWEWNFELVSSFFCSIAIFFEIFSCQYEWKMVKTQSQITFHYTY